MRVTLHNGLLGLACLWVLAGCATYGERQAAALQAVEQGNYEIAEQRFTEALKPRDALLYDLEVGMVRHLAGDYAGSNALLQHADEQRDALAVGGYAQQFSEFMTSPAQGVYRGAGYEYAYVNYFKALNFLALAQETGDPRWLDAARVEARRLDIILNEFSADAGDYLEQATDEDSIADNFLEILQALRGDYLDPATLIYRDDAWARFLIGVTYENLGEWDNARIAYQQAARAYELGYAEQYNLGHEPARLAWTATVRMMRTGGGWNDEWPRLIEEHGLNEADTEPLARDEGLLLVVEHVDRVAPIGELNLFLHQKPEAQALMLRPIISREGEEGMAQLAWFMLHYADHGIADLLLRYRSGGVFQVLDNPLRSKQVFLGPLWELAEESGFLAAVGPLGLRVSVPWYPPAGDPPSPSHLHVRYEQDAGETQRLVAMADMEQVKRQERLRLAQEEMTAALLREAVKNYTSATASRVVREQADEGFGVLVDLAGRAAATATARAETRHWSTLPRQARVAQLRLPTGEQEVWLQRRATTFNTLIAIQPRQVNLHFVRTFED